MSPLHHSYAASDSLNTLHNRIQRKHHCQVPTDPPALPPEPTTGLLSDVRLANIHAVPSLIFDLIPVTDGVLAYNLDPVSSIKTADNLRIGAWPTPQIDTPTGIDDISDGNFRRLWFIGGRQLQSPMCVAALQRVAVCRWQWVSSWPCW